LTEIEREGGRRSLRLAGCHVRLNLSWGCVTDESMPCQPTVVQISLWLGHRIAGEAGLMLRDIPLRLTLDMNIHAEFRLVAKRKTKQRETAADTAARYANPQAPSWGLRCGGQRIVGHLSGSETEPGYLPSKRPCPGRASCVWWRC
jgi:hypothetical protein